HLHIGERCRLDSEAPTVTQGAIVVRDFHQPQMMLARVFQNRLITSNILSSVKGHWLLAFRDDFGIHNTMP
ncbi:MAG: hypothetical protein ACLQSR_15750, partial [Limisphaerales bacterium]